MTECSVFKSNPTKSKCIAKSNRPFNKYRSIKSKVNYLCELLRFKCALTTAIENDKDACVNESYGDIILYNQFISRKNAVVFRLLNKISGHVNSFGVKYLFKDYDMSKYCGGVDVKPASIKPSSYEGNEFEGLELSSRDGLSEEYNYRIRPLNNIDTSEEIEKCRISISKIMKNYEKFFMKLTNECDNNQQLNEVYGMDICNFRLFQVKMHEIYDKMRICGGFWLKYATNVCNYSSVIRRQLNIELDIVCTADITELLVDYSKLKDTINEQIKDYELDIKMLSATFDALNKDLLPEFVGKDISYKFAEEWAMYREYHSLLSSQCDDENMREKLRNPQSFLDINYSFVFDRCDDKITKRLLEIEDKLIHNKKFEDYICCMKICRKRINWLEEVMEIDRLRLKDIKNAIKELRKII